MSIRTSLGRVICQKKRCYSQTPLTVLGLESSADDTCASVVQLDGDRGKILSSIVIKQNQIHEKFGGIHPLFAQESHMKNMPIAIRKALEESKKDISQVDGVAFTRGPGMMGCLSVCLNSAKGIAAAAGKPLIGVHHMQAHALTPFLTETVMPTFPFLTLLVSGGHTMLVYAQSAHSFEIHATSKDECIGDAIDKACRDLKVAWSTGEEVRSPGAAMEAFVELSDDDIPAAPTDYAPFVIPMPGKAEFSFSGTRSHLGRVLEAKGEVDHEEKRQIGRKYMISLFEQVAQKVKIVLKRLESQGKPVSGLVVSGGVASNIYLRTRLRALLDKLGHGTTRLIYPPVSLCTDNAAMIAYVGALRLQQGKIDNDQILCRSKWNIEQLNEQDL